MRKRTHPPGGSPDAPSFEAADWLAVSTDGFASMNAGRDPAHLVKELVQNALDALGDSGGRIVLTCTPGGSDDGDDTTVVTCRDDGTGVPNLRDIRTVFYTTKTDSHLQRGRMGRGFKEMLCLAKEAEVSSGGRRLLFLREGGRRVTREVDANDAAAPGPLLKSERGTFVRMVMPWVPAEVIPRLEEYFQLLLPPAAVTVMVNERPVWPREPAHAVEATLPTELFEQGKWVRPARRTTLKLVPTRDGETPTAYELGIPVCPLEWSEPYHVNVLQRVPMNPCRDAVASGFLVRLHRCCLPVLLPQMDGERVRQDWVGNAVPHADELVQKEIIRRGFGENVARSVPKMGVRQFDEDAREIGVTVIDTKQTSGGFRQVLQRHVPTTKEVVDRRDRELIAAAAGGGFTPEDAFGAADRTARSRRKLIEAAGGRERVQRVMEFARWFCQQLLDGYGDVAVCSVTLAPLKPVDAVATWGTDDVLTLGIDTPWLWSDPVGERTLSVLVHEAAHHLNAHHGRDFHNELERLAGRAARVMLLSSSVVHERWGDFFTCSSPLTRPA